MEYVNATPGSSTPAVGYQTRVAIIEWDRLVADQIRRMTSRCLPDAEIVIFHTGGDALAALRGRPAQLALTGLAFPDIDGLEFVAMVRDERLASRVLVVSGRRDERTQRFICEKSVAGYFDPRSEDPNALQRAIRTILDGGRYCSSMHDGAEPNGTKTPLHELLTPAELQVCFVVATGCGDKQAAARLGVGSRTVQSHLRSAMSKLGVHSRCEVICALGCRGYMRFEPGGVVYPGTDDGAGLRTRDQERTS